MNHITIELCAEDRARIDKLTQAVEAMAQNQPRQLYAIDLGSAPESAETEPDAPEAETPKETQPEPEKPTEPKNEAPAVTVDDIRSQVLALTAAGKKEELKAIIKEYAPKVSEIPAAKLAEVMDKLNALGAKV